MALTVQDISTHWLQQVISFVRVIPTEAVQYQINSIRTDPVVAQMQEFKSSTQRSYSLPRETEVLLVRKEGNQGLEETVAP